MSDTEAILSVVKALCGEIQELRMAIEGRNASEANYSFDEACQYLRISRTTLHERMRRGELSWATKIGGKWLFPKEKLKKYAGNQNWILNAYISI